MARGTSFNTIFSPVWSVELRSLSDPASYAPVTIPPHPIDSLFLPLADTEIVETPPDSIHLLWHRVPVPASSQSLEVVVTVRLRPDAKSEWNIEATVSDGPYGVYAVRFPYLALDVIGADGASDELVTPFGGGMRLADPTKHANNFAERATEGQVQDAFFTYPGQMFTQFMAYYDAALSGLYVQAEDPDGYTKNLYFNSTTATLLPSKRLLYLYFTHFNTAPSVGSGAMAEERRLSF